MNATRHQKASIGFAGGQVLAVRVSAEALEQLSTALAGERRDAKLTLESRRRKQ